MQVILALFFMEATPGFEPGMAVLQTAALPLGYVAMVCKGDSKVSFGYVLPFAIHLSVDDKMTLPKFLCDNRQLIIANRLVQNIGCEPILSVKRRANNTYLAYLYYSVILNKQSKIAL